MCGIFGIVTKDRSIPRGVLESAASALAHRGPDDFGAVIVETSRDGNCQVGFAHTRLSIIDLSPLGHQPMHDPLSGNWIVFNGEIYNFRELRAELEALGNRFQSHSDTEVILAAYRTWGAESFDRLRGMFALALWDASRQTLLLVRDPMGIKPLYYYDSGNCFLFSSEVRTLLKTGLVPRQIDGHGFFTFLAFGSVYEPRTIIEGIAAVPPGHTVSLELEKDSVTNREYWNPLAKINSDSDAGSRGGTNTRQTSANGNAAKNLTTLLRDAVLSHLVSDVPVGVFLSGGIDSSTLVALMSNAGARATTFSLVFREAEFDEGEYSRLVARRFGSDHHELMVSQQDALGVVPQALSAMDQPTIDGINTFLVSAKARAAGVKVALTGLGADEMFAGYSTFRDVPCLERVSAGFSRLPSWMRRPVAASVAALGSKNDRGRKISQMAAELVEDENVVPHKAANKSAHPYFVARSLFPPAERQALYADDFENAEREMSAILHPAIDASSGLDPVNRVSYLESTFYMRNTLLRDSDFMSMAHGLELRLPFLDRALVEACFRIPGDEKLQGDTPKSLLLKNLGVELPSEIVNRPKRGFTLPFEHWLRAEMKPMVEETLSSACGAESLLNAGAVREVWSRFLAGQTSWSRPWS
ncbi:MAG: asparagine synthase (glutamine-hydrolyzing), partial [Terriglobales bacterium]